MLTLRQRGIRNNIFFRLDIGPLRDAEIPTANEDVPKGAPILQHLCYELPFPWCAHAIVISVWNGNLTAKVGRDKNYLFDLYFTSWDTGWLLSISPPDDSDELMITELISALRVLVTGMPNVNDVRWFHDEVLTCGMFHEHDFDFGTTTPFDAVANNNRLN